MNQNQAHTEEAKKKKVLTFLRLRSEGWPARIVERRAGTNLRRAAQMAAKLNIRFP